MAPDFEYLLRLEPMALISHASYGLFLFCVPIGLATVALWAWLLCDPTRDLFALGIEQTHEPRTFGWWLRAAAAVLIGSATHVGWDAFTHRDTWGPVLVPALKYTAFSIGTVAVTWYNVLQYASTVVGGLVVLVWLWRLMQRSNAWPSIVTEPWRQRIWGALILFATLFGVWNANQHGMMSDQSRVPIILGRFAVGVLTGFTLALTMYSAIVRRFGRSAQ